MPGTTEFVLFRGTVGDIHGGKYVVAKDLRVEGNLRKHYVGLYGKHSDPTSVSPAQVEYAKKLWAQMVSGSTAYNQELFWGVLSAMSDNTDFSLEKNLSGFMALLRRDAKLRRVVLAQLKLNSESKQGTQFSPIKLKVVQVFLQKSASTEDLKMRLKQRPQQAEQDGKAKLCEKRNFLLPSLYYHFPEIAKAQPPTTLKTQVLFNPLVAMVVLANRELRKKFQLNSEEICTLIEKVNQVGTTFEADRYFELLVRHVLEVQGQSSLLAMVSDVAAIADDQENVKKAVRKMKEYFYGKVVRNKAATFEPRSFTCRFGLIQSLLAQPQLFVALVGAGTPPAHLMDLLNLAFDSPRTLLDFVKSLSEKPQTRKLILDNIGHIVLTLERQGFSKKTLNVLLRTKITDGRKSVKLGNQLHHLLTSENSENRYDVPLEQLSNDYIRGKINLSAGECLSILSKVGANRQQILSLVMLADYNLYKKLGNYRKKKQNIGSLSASAINYFEAKQTVEANLKNIIRGDLRAISENNAENVSTIRSDYALVIASDPRLWARITSRQSGWFGFKESQENWRLRVRTFKESSLVLNKRQELEQHRPAYSVLDMGKLLVDYVANPSEGRKVTKVPAAVVPPSPTRDISAAVVVPSAASVANAAVTPSAELLPPAGTSDPTVVAPAPERVEQKPARSTPDILVKMGEDPQSLLRKKDLGDLTPENFAAMVEIYKNDPKFLEAVVQEKSIFQKIAPGGDIVICGGVFLKVVYNGDIQAFRDSKLLLRSCCDDVFSAISQSFDVASKQEQMVKSRPADLSHLLSGKLDDELISRHVNDLEFWKNAVAKPEFYVNIRDEGVTKFVQKVLLGKPIDFVASIFKSCCLDLLRTLIDAHVEVSRKADSTTTQLINFWRYAMGEQDLDLRNKIGTARFIPGVLFKVSKEQIIDILSQTESAFVGQISRSALLALKERPSVETNNPQIRAALLELSAGSGRRAQPV